jgi:hypothetical protein
MRRFYMYVLAELLLIVIMINVQSEKWASIDSLPASNKRGCVRHIVELQQKNGGYLFGLYSKAIIDFDFTTHIISIL